MALLEQLLSLLTLGTLILAAYGVGRPVVRALKVTEQDVLTATVWSLAIGLVIWGTGLGVLGLVGGLNRPLIVAASLAAAFWGLGEAVRAWLDAYGPAKKVAGEAELFDDDVAIRSAPPEWLRRGVLILAMVAAAGSLVGALAPPTAGDAMCYHLELPKRFFDAGGLTYLPYHDNSTFPLLVEMWYLWAMALDGPVAAQLVHWAVGILFALAVVVLARPILPRRWAALAGAIVLLTPGVTNQMTAPMNDVALALFTTLWLAAWWRAVVGEEGRGWLVLAGVAAGGAIGTKYLALAFGVAVATGWLWMLWRRPERRRSLVLGMAIVGAVAAGTGGLWYARAAWHRGNPVYPFFCDVQGSGVMGAAAKETFSESRLPLGRGPVGLVAAPWYATMRPERLGDRGHQLGVLFLAALPGLLVARRLRGLGTLLIIAVVYVVLWYELRQYVRFLFPIVAPLSVAVVWAWMEMRRFPPRALQCAVAVQAVVLVAYALVPLHRGEGAWAVAAGIESRRDYLDRHEPTYGMATLANVLVKPGEQILSEDSRLFYFDPSITQEKVFRRACHYERRVKRPEDLSGELRAAGFTHLLLVENTGELGEMFDSTLARLAEADPSVERLAQCIARDADGGERRYRLVKLGGAARR